MENINEKVKLHFIVQSWIVCWIIATVIQMTMQILEGFFIYILLNLILLTGFIFLLKRIRLGYWIILLGLNFICLADVVHNVTISKAILSFAGKALFLTGILQINNKGVKAWNALM